MDRERSVKWCGDWPCGTLGNLRRTPRPLTRASPQVDSCKAVLRRLCCRPTSTMEEAYCMKVHGYIPFVRLHACARSAYDA
jgi:hypothetical protein